MKRILKTICCLAILLCFGMNVKANEFTVRLDSTKTNDEIKVNVLLENNPGLVSMLFDITYDSNALTLVNVKDSGNFGITMHSTTYTSPYSLCWANDTAYENIKFNGVIATLTFKINENAKEQEYSINVSYEKDNYAFINVDLEQYNPNVINTKVSIEGKNTESNQEGQTNQEQTNNEEIKKVVKIEKKDPTCTEKGNVEYYFDETENKYYLDEQKTQETTLENVQLDFLEHDYLTNEDGTKKCSVCGDILDNEDVDGGSFVLIFTILGAIIGGIVGFINYKKKKQ